MKKFIIFLSLVVIVLTSCSYRINILDYYNKTVEIVCLNDNYKAYGTGTIISNDGLIITNKHIVSMFTSDSVIMVNYVDNNETYEANIVNISNEYDLALLSIERVTDYFYNIKEEFSVGEDIYGIGNPQGLGLTLYKGIISSSYKYMSFNNEKILSIQTNIEFDDGASGGPVFNNKGELLGIMTYRLKNSYGYIPGISYMIPSTSIKQFLETGG